MAEMFQIVVLTTHEVSAEGLHAIFKAAADHSFQDAEPGEFSAGTAFKLQEKVTIPDDPEHGMPALGPQNISPIYGPLAL